jgi:hypothetical protein
VAAGNRIGDRERKAVLCIASAQLLILVVQKEALVETAQSEELAPCAKKQGS